MPGCPRPTAGGCRERARLGSTTEMPAACQEPEGCTELAWKEPMIVNVCGSCFTQEEPKASYRWGAPAPLVSIWHCSLLSW